MGKTPENTAIIVSPAGVQTRSVLENPSYSLSDPKVIDALFDGNSGGGTSESGQAVTPKRFLSVAAVWQCVNMVARDIAKLPFDLYLRKGPRDREKANKHPVFDLVHAEPNESMCAFVFWQFVISQLKIWGNAYIFIERDLQGRPLSLLPLLADRTAPKRIGGVLFFATEVSGRIEYADAADIIHLRGIGLDCVEGMALLDAARETAGRALAAGNFASKFFRNGARAGGVLTLPEGMSKQAGDRVDADFQKKIQDPKYALKMLVLREGVKFQQLTIPPNEGQLTETREYEVKEAARFFNVPCSRLGVTGSVSYNSKAADDAAYLDSALMPDLVQISQECRRKLLTPKEKADGYYFEHNSRAMIFMDPLTQMQIAALGARIGVFNPNEIRSWWNLNARSDGLGDEYYTQLNAAGYGQQGSANNTKIGNEDPDGEDGIPADPNKPAPPPADTPATKGTEAIPASVGLNGAQITAAVEVLAQLQAKTMAGPVAVELLVAVGIERTTAEKMVSDTEAMPVPEPTPAPAPAPDAARSRFLYAIARHARHKASKPTALRQWIDTPWPQWSTEAEQAGIPAGFLEERRAELSKLWQDTDPDQLLREVDSLASLWEKLPCNAPA